MARRRPFWIPAFAGMTRQWWCGIFDLVLFLLEALEVSDRMKRLAVVASVRASVHHTEADVRCVFTRTILLFESLRVSNRMTGGSWNVGSFPRVIPAKAGIQSPILRGHVAYSSDRILSRREPFHCKVAAVLDSRFRGNDEAAAACDVEPVSHFVRGSWPRGWFSARPGVMMGDLTSVTGGS